VPVVPSASPARRPGQQIRPFSKIHFYSIRRLIQANAGLSRIDIRPDANLDCLIGPQDRGAFWEAVQKEIGVDLPWLRRSRFLQLRGDQFPDSIQTVRQLVLKCCSESGITGEFQISDEANVMEEVYKLTSEAAFVGIESLKPDTRFMDIFN